MAEPSTSFANMCELGTGKAPSCSTGQIYGQIIERNRGGLCKTFGLEAGCGTSDIMAKLIGDNEKGWSVTRNELCKEVKSGVPEATVVQNAGLAEGTKLGCAAPATP